MREPLIPRRIVISLIVATLLLPIIICIVFGVSAMLGAMGDAAGASALQRIALVGGILWTIDLVCLVVVLAVGTLRDPDEPH